MRLPLTCKRLFMMHPAAVIFFKLYVILIESEYLFISFFQETYVEKYMVYYCRNFVSNRISLYGLERHAVCAGLVCFCCVTEGSETWAGNRRKWLPSATGEDESNCSALSLEHLLHSLYKTQLYPSFVIPVLACGAVGSCVISVMWWLVWLRRSHCMWTMLKTQAVAQVS